MVQAAQAKFETQHKSETQYNSETRYTIPEQYTPKPPTTTTYKLSNILTARTFRDLTYKLDPYKKNPSDSPLTTLTHILECYDYTLRKLQSLDIDSQIITQSSKSKQTTLESLNLVFRSSSSM